MIGFFPAELNHLVSQSGNGQEEGKLDSDVNEVGQAFSQGWKLGQKGEDDGKKGDADQENDKKKGRPAARVEGGVFAGIAHGQLLPGLIGIDAFMLCSMVLEDPLNILHERDQVDIDDEKYHFDQAVD